MAWLISYLHTVQINKNQTDDIRKRLCYNMYIGSNVKIHRKQKKSVAIGFIVAVLVLGAAFSFAYWKNKQPTPDSSDAKETSKHTDIDYSPPTEEQKNGGDSAKKDLASQDDVTANDLLSIEISAFKKSDSKVHVTANINNLVTSEGSCELLVTKDNASKKQQSGIVAVTNYSTCKGFDVTNLSSGKWQIQVNVTSGSKSGSSITTVEV